MQETPSWTTSWEPSLNCTHTSPLVSWQMTQAQQLYCYSRITFIANIRPISKSDQCISASNGPLLHVAPMTVTTVTCDAHPTLGTNIDLMTFPAPCTSSCRTGELFLVMLALVKSEPSMEIIWGGVRPQGYNHVSLGYDSLFVSAASRDTH